MSEDVTMRILDLAAGVLGVSRDRVSARSNADQFEEWDSLAQLSLLVAIEDEFGLLIDPADVADLDDLGMLAELIAARRS